MRERECALLDITSPVAGHTRDPRYSFSPRRGMGSGGTISAVSSPNKRLQAAAYSVRSAPASSRAWRWPAWVRAPCRRRSPLEAAEGISPQHCMRGRGESQRGRSPRAAPAVTATVPCTARRAWRVSMTERHRHGLTGAWRACSRRGSPSVWSLTARTSACQTMGGAGVEPSTALSPRRGAGPQGAWPG
jgi:hypothetical protein